MFHSPLEVGIKCRNVTTPNYVAYEVSCLLGCCALPLSNTDVLKGLYYIHIEGQAVQEELTA